MLCLIKKKRHFQSPIIIQPFTVSPCHLHSRCRSITAVSLTSLYQNRRHQCFDSVTAAMRKKQPVTATTLSSNFSIYCSIVKLTPNVAAQYFMLYVEIMHIFCYVINRRTKIQWRRLTTEGLGLHDDGEAAEATCWVDREVKGRRRRKGVVGKKSYGGILFLLFVLIWTVDLFFATCRILIK